MWSVALISTMRRCGCAGSRSRSRISRKSAKRSRSWICASAPTIHQVLKLLGLVTSTFAAPCGRWDASNGAHALQHKTPQSDTTGR